MSTVVFNPATPKRISAFVLFISDYSGLVRTGRTYSALGRSILYTRSLVRASTPPPLTRPVALVFVHCWKNKYDLASRRLLARNWNQRCSIPP